jgi:hypothetical protein
MAIVSNILIYYDGMSCRSLEIVGDAAR